MAVEEGGEEEEEGWRARRTDAAGDVKAEAMAKARPKRNSDSVVI